MSALSSDSVPQLGSLKAVFLGAPLKVRNRIMNYAGVDFPPARMDPETAWETLDNVTRSGGGDLDQRRLLGLFLKTALTS